MSTSSTHLNPKTIEDFGEQITSHARKESLLYVSWYVPAKVSK